MTPSDLFFELTAPGKSIVLGEYGALLGYPTLVTTTPDLFHARIGNRWSTQAQEGWTPLWSETVATESPAGRWLQYLASEGLQNWNQLPVWIKSPSSNQRGFGSSTFEFLALYFYSARRWPNLFQAEPKTIFEHYQKIHEEDAVPPSGVDLLAQLLGGTHWIEPRRIVPRWTPITKALPVLIFSASHQPGRKTATHSHLDQTDLISKLLYLFPEEQDSKAKQILRLAQDCVEKEIWHTLGICLKQYSEIFSLAGLENNQTREERLILSELPGVLGVKGSGALFSDAILILTEPSLLENSPMDYQRILACARQLDLVLVSEPTADFQLGLTERSPHVSNH